MLWPERDNWRFADQVRQPFLMARGKAVVAAWNDVVQFVERIAVWDPGFAFLVGVKEVAVAIKSQRVGNADTCRDGFEFARGFVPLLNRAAFGLNVVERNLVLGITACAIVVLGAFARGVPVDYDLLKFLPSEAESVTAQHDLSARSDYGTDVVVVAASDVEDARKKAAELAAKPNVGRVESIASFLPSDQDRKLVEIATMRRDSVSTPPVPSANP